MCGWHGAEEALSATLGLGAKAMLLDEPTEGVQPSIIDEISEVLQELQAKQNLTIVIVEQNLDFIVGLASRIYTISRGVLDTEIPIEEIQNSAMVAEYLGFGSSR